MLRTSPKVREAHQAVDHQVADVETGDVVVYVGAVVAADVVPGVGYDVGVHGAGPGADCGAGLDVVPGEVHGAGFAEG